jgi:hypothetical protein
MPTEGKSVLYIGSLIRSTRADAGDFAALAYPFVATGKAGLGAAEVAALRKGLALIDHFR